MSKRIWVISVITSLVIIASSCQSKKSGCPGSFHHKASKNIETKQNV